ncbi:MAG: VWA domain-containing protein [Notoacmeibacter sp.]|nr:VWA domain-containing protein [Notoacmeibacter sp.]
MDAFDAAEAPAQEKILSPTQGSAAKGRLISIATDAWSRLMTPKTLAGPVAAAILVLPIGGWLTWHMMDTAPLKTVELKKDEGAGGLLSLNNGTDAAKPAEQEVAAEPAATPAPAPIVTTQQAPAQKFSLDSVRNEAMAPASGRQRSMPSRKSLNISDFSKLGTIEQRPADTQVLPQPENRDRVESFDTNPVRAVLESPVSTFSIDVDTASYALTRNMLNHGQLPDPESVRVEEFVNYFPYNWPVADSAEQPFKPTVTVVPSPWNAHRKLMHIAIKGYDVQPETRPQANLVFLVDVSGSMNDPDKLPLLKTSFRLLLDKLDANDTVSIVTYAGQAGVALKPTKASDKSAILAAIDALGAGGSTAGAAGINTAYQLAEENFVKGGVNRVMLATDGDFNVGQTSDDDLKTMIEAKREKGIFLSVFGFGRGNYNDQLMQVLAQNGNGTAAYIDTLGEAQKTLVQEATSTLFTIAKDVKIQVEFNPATVSEYRLVGYETRALAREDFNDDKKDAGDIGSGHSVTAIYEITPKGSPAQQIDELRYQKTDEKAAVDAAATGEYAFLKMRFKKPDSDTSELMTTPVTAANELATLDAASEDLRFSVAVAGFAQKLRKTSQVADTGWDAIATLAAGARGDDPFGYRSEFLRLVQLAKSLDGK